MDSRVGVCKVRHPELCFLWLREWRCLRAVGLLSETSDGMASHVRPMYLEGPRIEKHYATNLKCTGLDTTAALSNVVTPLLGE